MRLQACLSRKCRIGSYLITYERPLSGSALRYSDVWVGSQAGGLLRVVFCLSFSDSHSSEAYQGKCSRKGERDAAV